ncbi:MAG: cation diffusion facilitator family transporter [Bacteroidota bacterium]
MHNHHRPSHDSHESHHAHHFHGVVDPSIVTTERGLWAVKWSFAGLLATALLQVVVVVLSNSVALLADTIHNFGDAATAVPLAIAFSLARKKPSKRFTYGYGRAEDLAGVAVVATIFISAVVAGYETVDRFFHPAEVSYLPAVAAASIIGFLGNEGVAIFRVKVGKEIGSAALVADGYHARVDGFTSLAVLFGALGVWLGYPLADPVVGLVITIVILAIVWSSGKTVFIRILDGVEPEVTDEVIHAAHHVEGVTDVSEIRARWIGHHLHIEINVAVAAVSSAEEGHAIAKEVRHQLLHHLKHLGDVIVHVDPEDTSGEGFHSIVEHSHDGFPTHSH